MHSVIHNTHPTKITSKNMNSKENIVSFDKYMKQDLYYSFYIKFLHYKDTS
jgi:hypothetical protein